MARKKPFFPTERFRANHSRVGLFKNLIDQQKWVAMRDGVKDFLA
jgi:hypothetical protein